MRFLTVGRSKNLILIRQNIYQRISDRLIVIDDKNGSLHVHSQHLPKDKLEKLPK